MRKNEYDNRGLSLLELLVAITISILVFTVILSLSNTSIVQYKDIGTDVDLQNEAQLTSNQIRDWLMEVNEGIAFKDTETESILYLFYTTDKNELNEKNMIGEIKYDKSDDTLSYRVYEYGTDDSLVEYYLLSDKVKGFNCDVSNVYTENYITYVINYNINNVEWIKSNEFLFRNKIVVVDTANEIFGG